MIAARRCARDEMLLVGMASDPGMSVGALAVKHVVAHGVVLPAHGIVQRMHARVAPMAVQTEFGQGGARTRQFEQLFAGRQRDLGGHRFGARHRDRCRGNVVGVQRPATGSCPTSAIT
ncbi:hypothetical protein G6F65_019856 [Rhizopus arrhizus]|nr:hypothetical protein G6F65_019856 [Rhizopus arrhizus]